MSNRYAVGLGHGWAFRNDKQRKWFITMFNLTIQSVINRIDQFDHKSIQDIMGDNLGIMSPDTKSTVASAIRLRNTRTAEPNESGEWMEACYAEIARMQGNMINVLLVDSVWYLSQTVMYNEDYRFVSSVLGYRSEDFDDVEEELTDSLIKALITSDLNDDFVEAIKIQLPMVDADGIKTVADFEMACDD